MQKMKNDKFNLNKDCNDGMTFNECQNYIINLKSKQSTERSNAEIIKIPFYMNLKNDIIYFIASNKLVLYGGYAINALLPPDVQFYKECEFPDLDVYSYDCIKYSKKLVDYFIQLGYVNVQAKTGVHTGTVKVSVDFVNVVDITEMPKDMFIALQKNAYQLPDKTLVCPPDFLKRNMYLELSRPRGEVNRWEKVSQRLTLFEQYYPSKINIKCKALKTKKSMTGDKVLQILVNNDCLFLGGLALNSIGYNNVSDTEGFPFTVFSNNHSHLADIICKTLDKCNITHRAKLDEYIPPLCIVQHYGVPIVYIYGTHACHAYTLKKWKDTYIKIATIDTMLTLYFSIWFEFDGSNDVIGCMIKKLLEYRDIYMDDNYSIECYGTQLNLRSLLKERHDIYTKMGKNISFKDYEYYFLNYKGPPKKK
jgi:hypothetical protein